MVVLKTSSVNKKSYFGIHFTVTKEFIMTQEKRTRKVMS